MSKNQKEIQTDKNLEGIELALTRSEQFIEDNQKLLTYILTGVILVIFVAIALNRYVMKPRNQEAAATMYMAERYFERDSFNLALNGYGTYPGFLDVMDEFKLTKAARLAHFYAGVSYEHLGDHEKAIEYLSSFSTKDLLVGASAMGSLGDAYSNLGEYADAVKAYEKGADKYKNNFSSPILLKKAGVVYEHSGDLEAALRTYEKIKAEYPQSSEGREMNKYIGRIEAQLNN
ncbi:MAG: tetratricopeptide repeat protein [Bacteroidota bacterium]